MVFRLLYEQPIELLDHISSCVDSSKDLLAFSLTAKLFYTIIVPNHLHFRDLRCDLRRQHLWNALAERPALASRFRSLNLVSETEEPGYPLASGAIVVPTSVINSGINPDVPPEWISRRDPNRSMASSFEGDCIRALAAAVSCMSRLTRFCWESNGCQWTQQPKLLFAALKDSCTYLEELQIRASQGWDVVSEFDTASFPLWELSNLSRVSVSVCHSHGVMFHVPFQWPARMIDMLINRCPSLRDLHINYEGRNPICFSQLFEQGHWPHLRRLSITGDVQLCGDADPNGNAIAHFLEKHPWLECLHLRGEDIDSRPTIITPRTMPHLRSLSLKRPITISKAIPVDALQHLQYLAYIDLDGAESRDGTLHLLAQLSALRCVSVSCREPEALKGLVRAVPQLERLNFHSKTPWSVNYNNQTSFPSPQCCQILASLRRLTHITNLATIRSTKALHTLMEPVLERLAMAPNLRYIEMGTEHPDKGRWVAMERVEGAAYAGWHFTEDLGDARFSGWGEFFTELAS